jgi:hypothetical protein
MGQLLVSQIGNLKHTQESAQSGRESSADRPQAEIEFWTMLLQRTEVV